MYWLIGHLTTVYKFEANQCCWVWWENDLYGRWKEWCGGGLVVVYFKVQFRHSYLISRYIRSEIVTTLLENNNHSQVKLLDFFKMVETKIGRNHFLLPPILHVPYYEHFT